MVKNLYLLFFSIIFCINFNYSGDSVSFVSSTIIAREKNALNKFLVNYSTEIITMSVCIIGLCYVIQTVYQFLLKENNNKINNNLSSNKSFEVPNDLQNNLKVFLEEMKNIQIQSNDNILLVSNAIKELLESLKNIVNNNKNDFFSILESLKYLKDGKEGDDTLLKTLVQNINNFIIAFNKTLTFNNNTGVNNTTLQMPKEFSDLVILVKELVEKLKDEQQDKINGNQGSIQELLKPLIDNIEVFTKTRQLIENNNNNNNNIEIKKQEYLNTNNKKSVSNAFDNLYAAFEKQRKNQEREEDYKEDEKNEMEYDKFVLYVNNSIIDCSQLSDNDKNNYNKKILDFVMTLKIEQFFIYIKNYCFIGCSYDAFVNGDDRQKLKIEELFLDYKSYLLKNLPKEKSIKQELLNIYTVLSDIPQQMIKFFSERDKSENDKRIEKETKEKANINRVCENIKNLNNNYETILSSAINDKKTQSNLFKNNIKLDEFFMFWCNNNNSNYQQISGFLECFLMYFSEDITTITYDFVQKNDHPETKKFIASLRDLLFAFIQEKEIRKNNTEKSKEFFEYRSYFIDAFETELDLIISTFKANKELIIENYDYTVSAVEEAEQLTDKKYKNFSDAFLEYSKLLNLKDDPNSIKFFANILQKYILLSKDKIKNNLEENKNKLLKKTEELSIEIEGYKTTLNGLSENQSTLKTKYDDQEKKCAEIKKKYIELDDKRKQLENNEEKVGASLWDELKKFEKAIDTINNEKDYLNREKRLLDDEKNNLILKINSCNNDVNKKKLESEIELLEKLISDIDSGEIFIDKIFKQFNQNTNKVMHDVIASFNEYSTAHAKKVEERLYIKKLQKIFKAGSEVKIPVDYVDLPQMQQFRDMRAAAMIVNQCNGVNDKKDILNDYTTLPHMVLHGLPGTGKTLAIQKEVVLMNNNANQVFYMQFDRERDKITDLLKLVKDYIDLIIKPKMQKEIEKECLREEECLIAKQKLEKEQLLMNSGNDDFVNKEKLEKLKIINSEKIANIEPRVVFIIQIDEVNSLAKNIKNNPDSNALESTNALLTQIDFINEFNKSKGLYKKCFIQVCGTTNHLDSIEPAAFRPGRMQPVNIPTPNKNEKSNYFNSYFLEIESLWRKACAGSTELIWEKNIEYSNENLFTNNIVDDQFSSDVCSVFKIALQKNKTFIEFSNLIKKIIYCNKKNILKNKDSIIEKAATYIDIKTAIKTDSTKDFTRIQELREKNKSFFSLVNEWRNLDKKKTNLVVQQEIIDGLISYKFNL